MKEKKNIIYDLTLLSGKPVDPAEQKKKNSFVGTAEYVSPEVLNNQPANFGYVGLFCFVCQGLNLKSCNQSTVPLMLKFWK